MAATKYVKIKDKSKENAKARIQLLIARIVVYAILVFLTVLCLFAFYLLIVNSTRSNSELQGGFTLLPSGNFMENFIRAWTIKDDYSGLDIARGLFNSFIIAAFSALLTSYFSALTAYAIHVYDFKFKKFAFTFILAVMMIPTQVSALGYVKIAGAVGLTEGSFASIGSYIALILPSVAAPVVFFYMKQYMDSVLPLEIVESARVDGSNEFRTFNSIVLPIMKPAIAVQAIFTFVASWNNYFTPALLLNDEKQNTLPIMIAYLRSMQVSKDFDLGLVYMFILLSILPVIVVYIILSRSIIAGATAGAVKG